MESRVKEILLQIKNGTKSVDEGQSELMLLILPEEKTSTEETPVLVGHLIKEYGYNGLSTARVGTPVYEFKERYFFTLINLSSGKPQQIRFYKEGLISKHINFVIN